MSGTGKSHIALALGSIACVANPGVLYRTSAERLAQLTMTIADDTRTQALWGDYLGDHLGATALIDRLLHRSHVFVISCPSYRDWAHKQGAAGAQSSAKAMPEAATPAPNAPVHAIPGGARRRGK
jgi:DNA replication protein DnaC